MRIRCAHPIFVLVCGLWLVASAVLPALGAFDNPFLLLALLPVLLPVGLGVPVGALLLSIKRFRKRLYPSGIGWLAIPAACIFVYFHGASIGEALRFQWNKSSYDRVVADAATGKCDQIAKAPRDRSRAWKNRETGHTLSCSGTSRSLGGHYYLAGGHYASGTDECG